MPAPMCPVIRTALAAVALALTLLLAPGPALGDEHLTAQEYFMSALGAQYGGDLDRARLLYKKVVRLASGAGDKKLMASAYLGLSRVAREEGDLEEAERLYEKAVKIGDASP